MLSDCIKKYNGLTLEEFNELCFKIAGQLVKEKFSMEDLATFSAHVMELAGARLQQLQELDPALKEVDEETQGMWVMGFIAEIAMYTGIQIGSDYTSETLGNVLSSVLPPTTLVN
jgi:hypothetical protein